MLRAGKARPQEPVSGVGGATRGDSDASDSEDRVPVPVFQNSFGDAIQKALDSYATHPGRTALFVVRTDLLIGRRSYISDDCRK